MIFYFIKEFIISNPVKLTFILLISAMMGFGIRVDDISYQKALDKQDYKYIKRGDYYFIPIFEQNSPSFYKTIDIKSVTFGENYISYKEPHPLATCSYVISGILGIVLIVGIFVDDRDTNWEIGKIYTKTKLTKLLCDEENGEFFYHMDGKLLKKSKNREIFIENSDTFIQFLKTPNQFPDYDGTKSKIRDKKLDLILS